VAGREEVWEELRVRGRIDDVGAVTPALFDEGEGEDGVVVG